MRIEANIREDSSWVSRRRFFVQSFFSVVHGLIPLLIMLAKSIVLGPGCEAPSSAPAGPCAPGRERKERDVPLHLVHEHQPLHTAPFGDYHVPGRPC
jgi:hypothetical protein